MKPQEDQSRNSWIKEDDPVRVSNITKHKDGYEDILDERRRNGDLRWLLKTRDVPTYKYNHPRTPQQIREHVIQSDRVKYTVEQICRETGVSQDAVWKQADEVLAEMSHNLSMTAIRAFGVALAKIFKSLFRRLYVNEEGVERLRHLLQEYPVILMPSHRSYLDFLLVSYVFYHYDFPLPAIAAAMDFMGMKFIGSLLNSSGAFFIRRTFGTDKLYWAVFTEYVQTQIINGDYPLEFFAEGTRSRTAKSYVPRTGMLSASLETYFKAHVPDIMIVPISISYERTLEESLYAYELLGIPKPKESTSGLLKARSVLSEDYGNVHFFIGEPISIRQYSCGKVDRIVHSLAPRYVVSLTDQENHLIQELAYHIVRRQQGHMIITPWALISTVLMQNRDGIPVKDLVREVEWLKRHGSNLGFYVDWPGHEVPETVVRASLTLHKNLVRVSDEDFVELEFVKPLDRKKLLHNEVLMIAASHMALSTYRNSLLHVYIRTALVALSINNCSQDSLSTEELYSRYCFLERLLCKDFIFEPGHTKQDFNQAVLTLTNSGSILVEEDNVIIQKSINKHVTFLSQMFEPFLLGYWVLCQYLLSMTCTEVGSRPLPKKPKELIKEAQQLAVTLVQEGVIKNYEILSLDMLGNALTSFIDMGAVTKSKREGDTWVSPNQIAVHRITEEIGKFIETPTASMLSIAIKARAKMVVAAKM